MQGGIARDPAAEPARWREVFEGRRGRLTAGLLLLETLVAMQILVVATVMPAARRDLGDLYLYGWTFSASGLGQFAAIPIAGRSMDRFGARRLLVVALAVYAGGLLLAAVAPSMLVLVLARLLQGIGGGAIYAVSLGTVAKAYDERLRPRVLALLAAMWILPGLIGPPLGATLASTVGWRSAFVAPLPLLAISAALTFSALGRTPAEPDARLGLLWPVVLAVGAAVALAGLTDVSALTVPLLALGLGIALPALTRIVPAGTLTARPGLPAAAAAAFLLSAAFMSVDAFLPLMITDVRHRPYGEMGFVITAVTVAWSLGSWWQSRVAVRHSPTALTVLGDGLLILGLLVGATALVGWPLPIAYLGMTIGGVGMGIAFPTIPLSVMNAAAQGTEATELSATLLMDTLGIAIGAGLAGAIVASAEARGATLAYGIAGAFGLALVAALALLPVARRLPRAQAAAVDSAA